MRFRKLRIAWSVTCGIACVLLIVLWVLSYLELRQWRITQRFGFVAVDGVIMVVWGTKDLFVNYRMPTAALFVLGTLSWAQSASLRFSLRTLLIATTLVALVLGLIVYFAR